MNSHKIINRLYPSTQANLMCWSGAPTPYASVAWF